MNRTFIFLAIIPIITYSADEENKNKKLIAEWQCYIAGSLNYNSPYGDFVITPEYSPSYYYPQMYKLSPVQDLGDAIAQSFECYRMLFEKKTMKFVELQPVIATIRRTQPSDQKIKDFIENIYKAQIPLSQEEKQEFDKYLD